MQALLGVLVSWRRSEGATAMQAYGNAFWLLCAGSFVSFVAACFMKDTLTRRA